MQYYHKLLQSALNKIPTIFLIDGQISTCTMAVYNLALALLLSIPLTTLAFSDSIDINVLNEIPLSSDQSKLCREDVVIGSVSCQGNNVTVCQEHCGIHGTNSLMDKCCKYAGVSATVLAYEETDNWMHRINEYNKCTGANVRIKYLEGGEEAMPQALMDDVGVDVESGAGMYDAYIVRGPWMPPIYRGLKSLSGYIKESDIRFNDINQVTRDSVSFDGQVYGLPFDSHYIALGWRQDVFELHKDYYKENYGEDLSVPKTIEDLVIVSERLNGLDHNGDGTPDWGFCFTPMTNFFFTFLAPVLQTNTFTCEDNPDGNGFDCSHGSNTGQNIFFDVETFEPLIHNEGFRYVFDLYYRFIKSSNCQDSSDCDHIIDFPTGRCAGVLSLSDMMTPLLLDSIKPRVNKNGTVVWSPGQNLAPREHWGRRSVFPGSSKVIDWSDPKRPLIKCTEEKCPLGIDGINPKERINYTPFFSQAGEAYAINGRVSKPRAADAMWDMFAWISELPFKELPHPGMYRQSQLTDEYGEQLANAWDNDIMVADIHEVLLHYFKSQPEGGNPARDSRMLGFDEYNTALHINLHQKLIFADISEGGFFSKDGLSLDAERNKDDYNALYGGFIVNLQKGFDEMNENSDAGALGNLVSWRDRLDIHPMKNAQQICSNLLAKNHEVFGKLNCISALELETLCQYQKDDVEAYAPGTCSGGEGSDKTIIVIIALCCALGVPILALIGYFAHQRLKRFRKIASEQRQLTEATLNDSIRSLRQIDYPLSLVRGDEFVSEKNILSYEVLRNTHRLTVLDTLRDVDSFVDAGKHIVFLSHQWTSFNSPDATGAQFEAMCIALKELAVQSGWDESLKDVFVWVDYSCLPQANTSAQNLTIRSVAAYAASATYFIIVAPETRHTDLDEVCDLDTYQQRMWTRAEQVCHSMRNGTEGMFVTKGKKMPLAKVQQDFFKESYRMFEGELTCCRLEHKGMALCDRQCLVIPLLGLYGELYRETIVGMKSRNTQSLTCVEDFLTEIEKHQDEIFPRTFKRTIWHKNKQIVEDVTLFGDMIDRMKARIKSGEGFSVDDDTAGTSSMMGSDYVRHGAAHGIRF